MIIAESLLVGVYFSLLLYFLKSVYTRQFYLATWAVTVFGLKSKDSILYSLCQPLLYKSKL